MNTILYFITFYIWTIFCLVLWATIKDLIYQEFEENARSHITAIIVFCLWLISYYY